MELKEHGKTRAYTTYQVGSHTDQRGTSSGTNALNAMYVYSEDWHPRQRSGSDDRHHCGYGRNDDRHHHDDGSFDDRHHRGRKPYDRHHRQRSKSDDRHHHDYGHSDELTSRDPWVHRYLHRNQHGRIDLDRITLHSQVVVWFQLGSLIHRWLRTSVYWNLVPRTHPNWRRTRWKVWQWIHSSSIYISWYGLMLLMTLSSSISSTARP